MNMEAILSKLKELKLKMAELENAEDALPGKEQEVMEKSESPEMQDLEDKLGIEKHDASEEQGEELGDDELMEMFGKKKKEAPKPGMKIAIAVSKPKMKMGKFK